MLVLTAAALGILPPAVHGGPPPTVVRTVAVDEARLLPPSSAATLTRQGGVRVARPAWTRQTTACAPIRFTTVGLVWRQTGDAPIPTKLAWGRPGPFGNAIEVTADPDEGPDPGSPDDAGLVGTPPVWAGEATCARFRLRLPREEALTDVRAVFLNTSGTATEPGALEAAGDTLAAAWGMVTDLGTSPANALASQPTIISRGQWGAKESLRKCKPDYGKAVQMAYVHHTVVGNGYPASKADDIVRAIYAYHVKGNGWCDIGYNFLVDRFGRIYEGRFGGIERPVIGAHAMGFNTGSTGVAAIGTFTTRTPPTVMLDAFERLLAWRLDVAHARPTGTTIMRSAGGPNQKFDKGEQVPLPVITGHRDTGYTACPGTKLYARLQSLRTEVEALGLPKIWDPAAAPQSAAPGTAIRFTAALSTTMSWTVDILNSAGTPIRQLTGTGSTLDATWDGRYADGTTVATPGPYTVYLRARDLAGTTARDAVITVTLA
ncbi:MAG TPA: N-acetylmuramoyl-L-alanine amidase [Actinomycetota bacterium]|nr:N-acetylmuramoyl-L-alanine amidase [Actinomycetota bacterium]